jgi:hypothetical protein
MPVQENVKFANFFRSHMTGDVTDSATVIDIVDTSGLPTIVDDEYFYLVLNRLDDRKFEIVRVNQVISTCLHVDRAQEGTTALTFSHGDRVELWFTAGTLDDALEEIRREVNNAVIANTDAIDQGDVSIIGSVAYLINAAAGSPLHINLPSGGPNGGNYNAVTPITVPNTVLLDMENGSYLSGDWTLDKCQLEAPVNKIFDGGNITFDANVPEVYPQWWMANFDGVEAGDDVGPALTIACQTNKTVRFVGGQFKVPNNEQLLYVLESDSNVDCELWRFDDGARIAVQDLVTCRFPSQIEAPLTSFIISFASGAILESSGAVGVWSSIWVIRPQTGPDWSRVDRLINEICGGNGQILITGVPDAAFSATVPSSTTLIFENNAGVTIDGGATLTIDGHIQAGRWEIFKGAGSVAGEFLNGEIFPEWFASTVTNLTPWAQTPVGNRDAEPGTLHVDLGADVDYYLKRVGSGDLGWEQLLGVGVTAFDDGDATPWVQSYRTFKTANTSPTAITRFDGGYPGKTIALLIDDNETTIDFTSPDLSGNRGFAYPAAAGDTMYAVLDDAGVWHCIVNQTASPLAGWDWDSGWTQIAGKELSIDLDDIGPALTAFSDTAKADAPSGVTPASARLTDIISTIGPDDPGYVDMLVMVKQRDDVGASGPHTNYLTFAGHHAMRESSVRGWYFGIKGNTIMLYTQENEMLEYKDHTAFDLGWDQPDLDFDQALMRIKLKRG